MWLCRQAPGYISTDETTDEPVAGRPHTFGFFFFFFFSIASFVLSSFFLFLFSFTSDNDDTFPLSLFLFFFSPLSSLPSLTRQEEEEEEDSFLLPCYLFYTSVDSWRSALTTRDPVHGGNGTSWADGDDDDDDVVVHSPIPHWRLSIVFDRFPFLEASLPSAVHSLVIYLSTVQ